MRTLTNNLIKKIALKKAYNLERIAEKANVAWWARPTSLRIYIFDNGKTINMYAESSVNGNSSEMYRFNKKRLEWDRFDFSKGSTSRGQNRNSFVWGTKEMNEKNSIITEVNIFN